MKFGSTIVGEVPHYKDAYKNNLIPLDISSTIVQFNKHLIIQLRRLCIIFIWDRTITKCKLSDLID